MVEKLKKEKISDVLGFLSLNETQMFFNEYLDYNQEGGIGRNSIKKITKALGNINEHHFNNHDYSTEIYLKTRQNLIKKIKEDSRIIEQLKFLVHLTSLDNKFI